MRGTTSEKQAPRMVWSGHVVGVAEGAAFFDVQRSTFSQWAARRELIGTPLPVMVFGSGTFYDLQELLDWHWNWKPTLGAKSGTIDPVVISALGLRHPGGTDRG